VNVSDLFFSPFFRGHFCRLLSSLLIFLHSSPGHTFFCAFSNPSYLISLTVVFFAHRSYLLVYFSCAYLYLIRAFLSLNLFTSPPVVVSAELNHKILLYYGTGPSFFLPTLHAYIPATSLAKGCHSVTIRMAVKCAHEYLYAGLVGRVSDIHRLQTAAHFRLFPSFERDYRPALKLNHRSQEVLKKYNYQGSLDVRVALVVSSLCGSGQTRAPGIRVEACI
jgi:hypothetical protein